MLYFPSEGSDTQDFYALKNPSTPAGFELANLGSSKSVVVPWLQFVYTLFIPRGRLVIQPASFRSSSFAKHLPARCSFIFGNRKKSDGVKSGLYGGCSKMSQWNCSHRKACVCRAVCGRALLCNRTIPRESLPLWKDNVRSFIGLQKTNNTSHLTVGGIFYRHRHDHSYLCTYHVSRFDLQLHEATFQHHTEHYSASNQR